jgi:hypothetical protein
MIRKMCLIAVTIYVLMVMGGLLLDRDKEEVRWKQSGSVELKQDIYTNMEEWIAYNIAKSKAWTSTSNDPIMISPLFAVADAKQTYVHLDLDTQSDRVQVFWRGRNENFAEERSKVFDRHGDIEMMIDEDVEQIRIDPAERPGVTFTLHQVEVKKYK